MASGKRIASFETEYPLFIKGTDTTPSFSTLSAISKKRPFGIKSMDTMLDNGARTYVDVSLLEYSCPETTSYLAAVACQRAGMIITAKNVDDYSKEHGEEYDLLYQSRKIEHRYGGSIMWGRHLNLSADAKRIKIDEEHLFPFGLHCATMGIFSGAGGVDTDTVHPRFVFEQKAPYLKQNFSRSTSAEDHPVVNLADDPLINGRHNLKRVHITPINPNWSAWAERMTTGTFGLIATLTEQGYRGEDFMKNGKPDNSTMLGKIARHVSQDPTMQKPFDIAGKRIGAIDMQYSFLERASKLDHTDEDNWTMREWEKFLDDAVHGRERIADRVTWAAKYESMTKFCDPEHLGPNVEQAKEHMREWDRILPDGSPSEICRPLAEKDAPSREQILNAVTTPPQDTRAKPRAEAIRRYADEGGSANWYHVSPHSMQSKRIWFSDPFATTPS